MHVVLTEFCLAVFEALPIIFIVKRQFSVAHLGLIYICMACVSLGRLDLIIFHSCLHWNSTGVCNLYLAFKEHRRPRGEVGGIPTSRVSTGRCYNRRSTFGDRLLLAWLDRGVQPYPLVCSHDLDHFNWLRGQLGVRFVLGKPSIFAGEATTLISSPELHDRHVLVSFSRRARYLSL